MKLYFSPGACSLAVHVVVREAGLDVELVQVDLATKRTEAGEDFLAINPKGYVPALELDDGRVLTEAAMLVQYVADLRPGTQLVPPPASFERYRVQETLNFVATELHKAFSPLWHRPSDDVRAEIGATLTRRFEIVARQLGNHHYLFGDEFSVADAYLYAILRWARPTKVPLPPPLQAFVERVASRPAVQDALAIEGLKH
jgi:glutathione S-transferase